MYNIIFIFFSQAEDGIRYRNVTGVQTCALPILKFYGLKTQLKTRRSKTHKQQESRSSRIKIHMKKRSDCEVQIERKFQPEFNAQGTIPAFNLGGFFLCLFIPHVTGSNTPTSRL